MISLIAAKSAFKTRLGIVPASILLLSFISYGEFAKLGHWATTQKFQFDHARLVKEMSYPEAALFFYKDPELSDLNRAIRFIQENYGEPISVMDNNSTLLPALTDKAWCAAHNFSNFALLNEEYRIISLTNTMNRLQRSGWLLMEKKFEESQPLILKHFELIYNHGKRLDFGTYIAIRFTPK